MNLLAVVSREKRRFQKRISKLQDELNRLDVVSKALGSSTNHTGRKISAEARRRMSLAQKRRWAARRAGK